MVKNRLGKKLKRITALEMFCVLFLALCGFVTLYPFWHEVCISFSSPQEAVRGGLFAWPRGFSTAAYKLIFDSGYLFTSFKNSVIITVLGTAIGVAATAMLAYPLAKKGLPGRGVLGAYVIITMIFNGGMIPTYLTVSNLGLINSLWVLILINCVSGFNIIVMRNFFSGIPDEIEESALIDGANPLIIFFRMVVPLSAPVIATVSLWISVGLWNDFFNALIYINDRSKQTISLLMRDVVLQQEYVRQTGDLTASAAESVVGATIVIAVLPIMCVYPFLQKYFVKGVMIGAIKG